MTGPVVPPPPGPARPEGGPPPHGPSSGGALPGEPAPRPPAPSTGPAPWPEAPSPLERPPRPVEPPRPEPRDAGGPSLAPQEGDGRPPELRTTDEALLDGVIAALRTCYDPEIPLNIYDLSLIYAIDVDATGHVEVKMTLTSPTCPVAGTLPGEVQQKVAGVPGVTSAQVDLVWDPPWDLSRLSEAARLTLGIG